MQQPPKQYIPPPYYQEDDEITLKELILKIQEFAGELWRQKLWIILIAIVCGGIGWYFARNEKTTYTASISFLVSQDAQKENNQLVSELLGISAAGYTTDKIVELVKSGRILHAALLQEADIDGEKNLLANHLINLYNYHAEWEKEQDSERFKHLSLNDFYFQNGQLEDLTSKEKRAISILQELIVVGKGNNALLTIDGGSNKRFSSSGEIITLTITTLNEALSTQLLDAIYTTLDEFYIQQNVGKPQQAYNELKVKRDSLEQLLNQLEASLAYSMDRSKGILSQRPLLEKERLTRKVERVNAKFISTQNNVEKLEFILSSESPEFEVLDLTFIPEENRPSKIKNIAIGGFLGGFLAVVYFLGRKIIRDAMAA